MFQKAPWVTVCQELLQRLHYFWRILTGGRGKSKGSLPRLIIFPHPLPLDTLSERRCKFHMGTREQMQGVSSKTVIHRESGVQTMPFFSFRRGSQPFTDTGQSGSGMLHRPDPASYRLPELCACSQPASLAPSCRNRARATASRLLRAQIRPRDTPV